MRIVVLGSTGGVGRHVVQLAVQQGYDVVALARSTNPGGGVAGVRVVTGDATDRSAIAAVVDGADVVVSCLGVRKGSKPGVGPEAMAHLVEVSRLAGPRRLVAISGAGVDVAGDAKGWQARAVTALLKRIGGPTVPDKQAEYTVLACSDLDWTLVRPPRMVDGEPTGTSALTAVAPGFKVKPVPRGEVARVLLSLAAGQEWVRRAPFLVQA
jgi:uncharacterized protein YbjT (DUF2867 family)